MNGYIYRSYNTITDMYYVGCKISDEFVPDYYGSGTYLREALKMYGKDSFTVELLEWVNNFDDKKQLYKREKYWVEYYDAARSNNYYNISATGNSGNTILGLNEEDLIRYKNKQRIISKNRMTTGKGMFGRGVSLAGKNNPMYGKKHTEHSKELNRFKHLGKKASEETRTKMRASHSPDNTPPSHKGRKSVNNGVVVRRIYPNEISEYLEDGWKLGGLKRNG